MLQFVNAKLNLGLFVTSRRPDGYHNLSTVFYPVGLYAGTPQCPYPFSDILEITPHPVTEFRFTGKKIDCPDESNLVVKAYRAFFDALGKEGHYLTTLEKHLPDGAGMGGGSADASFVLKMLNHLENEPFSTEELERIALTIGADCPFFIRNTPCYAEGVGEVLEPIEVPLLKGKWCVIAKPELSISTKEAFAGVTPREPDCDLREVITKGSWEDWSRHVTNDFSKGLFENHLDLPVLQDYFYISGADFALMTGSGASVYGIFSDKEDALEAYKALPVPYRAITLL